MANLNSLIVSIKDWSKRKNIPDSTISEFIEIALSRANWALRVPVLEGYTAATIDDDGYIVIPANFIEMKEISIVIGTI